METLSDTLELGDQSKKGLERGSHLLEKICFNLSYSKEPHLFGQVKDGLKLLGNQ